MGEVGKAVENDALVKKLNTGGYYNLDSKLSLCLLRRYGGIG